MFKREALVMLAWFAAIIVLGLLLGLVGPRLSRRN